MSKRTLLICVLFLFVIYFIQLLYVNSQSSAQYNHPTQPNYMKPQTGYGGWAQSSNSPQSSNASPENILIILDSSYSMEERINGRRKIDIAKDSINHVLSQLPPNVWVGLRVYGHKMGFLGFNACRASELKVPIGPNNQNIIRNVMVGIEPKGMTPITYSLQQSSEFDFAGLSGKKRIILVSDGMETCDGSPCEYAVSLVKNNIQLKIDTIGFNLSEPEAVSQLKCTALATKGRFYTANNASELVDRLKRSIEGTKEVQGKIINGQHY